MSLEDVIKEQINKKGKARIWFDYVLEQLDSKLTKGMVIGSPYSSLPIGSVDTIFSYDKKTRKMKNLAKILRVGYVDFFNDVNLEKQLLNAFEEKKQKAKTFRRYKEFKELEGAKEK